MDPDAVASTDWPPQWLINTPMTFGWSRNESRDCQPGIGLTLNWNKPNQRLKPFVLLRVGYWELNIGWLFS